METESLRALVIIVGSLIAIVWLVFPFLALWRLFQIYRTLSEIKDHIGSIPATPRE